MPAMVGYLNHWATAAQGVWDKEIRFIPVTNVGRQRIHQQQHDALHPDCKQPIMPTKSSRPPRRDITLLYWNALHNLRNAAIKG
ncbi:hypothetical protein TNCV_1376601 [Trichonephila clavipes]|nr:hypothetical protein TNCV_1376601 [Trichonephila clavipes]